MARKKNAKSKIEDDIEKEEDEDEERNNAINCKFTF